ncbi:MAG: TadE/TadG family type IV pilus assembly protein [Thermodesulfobacteriota bacterium]|nr:TadE/TadG family type IV pilus assembly protein [Thermodesulfobacteriota bacterium]
MILIAMSGKKLRKDESGQAMVEFVVVFPVVFLLCLVIMQTFLLLSARQVVNYAAYCAARSAIVFLPDSGNSVAKKKAERAAIIACWSISPMKDFGSAEKFIKPIEDMVEGATGIDFELARRYNMARSNVSVELKPAKLNAKTPHQDVTAEVTYHYVMGIPLANRIFYEMWKRDCKKKGKLYTFTFKASCTLPAAGKVKTKKCC